MTRDFKTALALCLATFLITAVAYPAVVWGGAQLLFPWRARGSLIERSDRTVVGSRLVAQSFKSPRYFHPRPSAVDYKADGAGGSNLASTNPQLAEMAAAQAAGEGGSADRPLPVDLASRSGSGLDPDLSVESALFQVDRVAAARGVRPEAIREAVMRRVDHSGWILGAPPRVNVLELNWSLDDHGIVRD